MSGYQRRVTLQRAKPHLDGRRRLELERREQGIGKRPSQARALSPLAMQAAATWRLCPPTTNSRDPSNNEARLIFMQARFYAPYLNRWIQPDTIIPDPSNPQSLNRYSYVLNRPLVCIDPSGHCSWCWKVAMTVLATGATLFGNPLGDYRVDNFPEGPGMTDFLLEQMNINAAGEVAQTLKDANYGNAATKYAAYIGWAALVRGGGPWDFKVELNRKTIETIELAGAEYDSDVLANVFYGYLGRASGFSTEELLVGAGIAQIATRTSDWSFVMSNFDDPADQAAIWVGMYLYEKYGQYGYELTEDMLREALYLYDKDLNKPEQ